MSPAETPPGLGSVFRAGLRVVAGLLLCALGAVLLFGWPFVSVLEEPHFEPVMLPLTLWFLAAGGVFAASAFVARWRRWPWRRPRIRALRWLAGLLVVVLLPIGLTLGGLLATAPVSNVGELEFDNELSIPELLEPTVDDQGRLVFDLSIQEGQRSFLPGTTTETLGFNGDYLGPTLRAARGDTVRVNVTNTLAEATTVHWHGMHLPAAADGGPHQPIEPETTWSPEWTIDQPGGSLWYHPHLHGVTGAHVYRGLSGMFLLDDAESEDLDLPAEYGRDDIPLIVQDRQFDRDGSFGWEPSALSSVGVLGDEILVNGTHDPHLTVTDELVRLRLLNGSNNRIFDFGFSDDRPFWQIASDGGLLPEPHQDDRLMLSPGERAEIVVAFEPGDDVVLRSFPPGTGAVLDQRVGGADSFDILRIMADEELESSPALPERLAEIPPIVTGALGPDRVFELGEDVINGQAMDMARIDHVLTAGATEVWELTNTNEDPHNFHVHDRHFQVINVDGAEPAPELAGWKDTVHVPSGTTVRIAIRVGDYTDPETPYMFHCHLLTHEDNGMMGQFVVVEPGTEDQVPTELPPPHHAHAGH